MSAVEKKLLGNALDALDRLFDNQLSVRDVWALLFATSEALRVTPHWSELEGPVVALRQILGGGGSSALQRDRALHSTHELRLYLAHQLPRE